MKKKDCQQILNSISLFFFITRHVEEILRDGNPNVVNTFWLNHYFEDGISNKSPDYLNVDELILYTCDLLDKSEEKELFVSSISEDILKNDKYKGFFDNYSSKKKRCMVGNVVRSGLKKEIFSFLDKGYDNLKHIVTSDLIKLKKHLNIFCEISFSFSFF